MLTLCALFAFSSLAADGGTPGDAAGGVDAGATAAAQAAALDVSRLPFSPDSIAQVVRAHQPQIQACYEQMLSERQQKLEGRVVTEFVITPAGTVSGAKVVKRGTTLKDKTLHACVVGVLGTLSFPKPPDKKSHPVEYPFNLQAVE